MVAVRGVRSVAVDVCSLGAASDFYTEVWGLQEVGRTVDARYFRGSGAFHHILSLHAANRPAIRRVVFDAASPDAVLALHKQVSSLGATPQEPRVEDAPGSAFVMAFEDPEGRNLAVAADGSTHSPAPSPDRPTKVAHLNFNSRDYDLSTRFMTEALGFRLIDETVRARFLHADCTDHFSLALVKHQAATLNHIAFEMQDIDAVMRGAGRMKDAGYPIEWGVGRHGPGNNVFAYFAGPEEIPLEYTSEVLQIDETYVPRGPDFWKFPPGRSDQWGVTAPQTTRLGRIQNLFHFSEDGFRQ